MTNICGIICNCGPNGEPLACGYLPGHEGPHAWATLPTWPQGGGVRCLICGAEHDGTYPYRPEPGKWGHRTPGREARHADH